MILIYSYIHVGAAADGIPSALKDQLAVGGCMMIPVGPEDGSQYIYLCTKNTSEEVKCKKLFGVRYVPLTCQKHQLER